MKQQEQTFNDGVVDIYHVSNSAANGLAPVESLTQAVRLRYKERTVGIQRYYSAKQADAKIDRLMRCHRIDEISTQDVAVLQDGKQYTIDLIQYPEDIVPPVMDLTLVKVVHDYDLF